MQGGYLPFAFDITDVLKMDGGKELRLRANNEDNPITGPKPLKQLDYIQHGGIFVSYPRADRAEAVVQVKAEVSNTSGSEQLVTVRHALAHGGRQVARAG